MSQVGATTPGAPSKLGGHGALSSMDEHLLAGDRQLADT